MPLAFIILQALLSSVTINGNWTFNYFPSGDDTILACDERYDDSNWAAIALPHTWMTYETTGDPHPFIKSASERDDSYWWNGFGWYRKRLVFGNELRGKKIFVEFDAVQKYSRIYINGHLAGEHKGGYNSFSIDITSYVKFGQVNTLAVQVSSRRDDKFGTIPPATAGNFNVYGGIYRDVRIVIKNEVYIPFQGSWEYEGGTFVTTPEATTEKACYDIRTYVRNESGHSQLIKVKNTAKDADGKVICVTESEKAVADGATEDFHQTSDIITGVRLWSPEDPYLYSIHTDVYVSNGALVDTCETPLGFRTFSWDYEDNTLIVNGVKQHIHGTNRHQEYPWLGDSEPKWLMESDMMDIRYGMNTNFMRTAHYPQDPAVYDFNDRHGIITVEEVPNDKTIDFDREVQEHNMREMVRRDRNHPSIFFWSVGNETSCAADSRWTYEEDTTRIIHERKTEGYGDFVTHHADNLDMENLLRVTVRGWTDNYVKALEPKNEGSNEKSGQMAGNEEWQHTMARVQDGSIRGRIDGNIVCWLYADHGCDRLYKNAPLKNINYKGWVDLYRIPKYMYYLWQANYVEEPMVFIHPHFWQQKYSGSKKTFRVDSNCSRVELFVNGRSIGVKQPDNENFHTVEFEDVPVEAGSIKAVATASDGSEVSSEIKMAGVPYRVILKKTLDKVPADRSGINIITADVVDAQGNQVQGYDAPLHWEVKGEGTLVGCSEYTTDIDKNLNEEGTGYIVTPVPNLVRSTSKAGKITVTVTSEGLKSGKISFRSYPVSLKHYGITELSVEDSPERGVKRDNNFHEKATYTAEMGRLYSPAQIDAATSEEYEEAMKEFVLSHNPSMEEKSIEFKYLIKRLTSYIKNTHGELTEDDYNFIATSYNDARYLSHVIENKNFHPSYRQALTEEYASLIILKGKSLDISEAASTIESIPSGLDIVYVRKPAAAENNPPLQYGNTSYRYTAFASTLEELICLFHPEFVSWDTADKDRIYLYLDKINPNIERSEDGEETFSYSSPIAIPRELDRL